MGAVIGRQGRGELHSPQHVPKRDGGARRQVAGKLISIGGEWVTRAGKMISNGGKWVTPAGKINSVGNIGCKVAPEWVSNREIGMIYTQKDRSFGYSRRVGARIGFYFMDSRRCLASIEDLNGGVFLKLRLIEYFNDSVIVQLRPIEHFNEGVIAK